MISVVKQEYQDLQAFASKRISEAVHESAIVFSAASTPKPKSTNPTPNLPVPRAKQIVDINLATEPVVSLVGERTNRESVFIDLVMTMSSPLSGKSWNTPSEDSILSSRSNKQLQRKGRPPFGSSQPRFPENSSVASIGG